MYMHPLGRLVITVTLLRLLHFVMSKCNQFKSTTRSVEESGLTVSGIPRSQGRCETKLLVGTATLHVYSLLGFTTLVCNFTRYMHYKLRYTKV